MAGAHKEHRGAKEEGGVETIVQRIQREFDEMLADEWDHARPGGEAEVLRHSHVFKSEIYH